MDSAGRSAMKTVFILLLTAAPALPWGCEGHQAVALIAMKQLSAHALALVNQLLAGQPIDPALNRFCGPNALPAFAAVSTSADDIRKPRPDTPDRHFIDIPLGAAP